MSNYSDQLAGAFQATSPEQFGDGHATGPELSALRSLYVAYGKNRAATEAAITEAGYPEPDLITTEMVAEAGAAHACGVAIHLAEARGVEGRETTWESYTTKNQFDRYVALHLPSGLREAWNAPIQREPGFENPDVEYPDGVDHTLIHGGGKPHRFFPAQTMRHLEFIRLGKADEQTRWVLGIWPGADLRCFNVRWNSLIPVIESATDVVQLAGDIGAEVARQLLENGLGPGEILTILTMGFNRGGMQAEHGEVQQTEEVYAALVTGLRAFPETSPLADALEEDTAA